VVDVDAVERRRKAVGIALAAHLAVAYDIDAGALHLADRQEGGVVLCLLEQRLRHAPERFQSDARWRLGPERAAVDEPIRLWVAADHRRE
jgi:hypothetical protein